MVDEAGEVAVSGGPVAPDRRLSRAVAAFGVVAAVLGAAGIAIDPAESSVTVAAPAASVLNVRRIPEVLRVAIGRERLATSIEVILNDPEFAAARSSSCLLATVDGGVVVNEAESRQVTPASTMKVVTSATALSLIDPGTRFTTEVRSAAAPSGGTLAGDLWLVGGGDPLLETADYTATQEHAPENATSVEKLADQVVAAGIRKITGSIVGDDRRYDDVRTVATWKRAYLTSGEVGPLSALSINDNFTTRNARDQRTASSNPPADAAKEFANVLASKGVEVLGEPRGASAGDKTAAEAAPTLVTSIESLPIEQVVAETLVWSDNTAAEMLLKEAGFRSSKKGSSEAGIAAVRKYLNGFTAAHYAAVDGSGLDRSDEVTCGLLVDVLTAQPVGGTLEAGLPVMGKTGTLRKRLRGDDAEGHVRAKTGSLNGVSSLAGFADTRNGGRAVFAFVGNGLSSTAIGVRVGDRIAQQLVRFPDAPDAASLALP